MVMLTWRTLRQRHGNVAFWTNSGDAPIATKESFAAILQRVGYMTIEQRIFGNTGLRVGVLGLGTAEIGFFRTDHSTVDSILGMAAETGINVLDTAAMYGDAEEVLGRLLAGRREKFLIFTKCGRHLPRLAGLPRLLRKVRREAGRLLYRPPLEWEPKTLQWNIEESLRRLKTDRLDLIQLHSCSEELLKRGDVIRTLQRAQDAGKVRYIGYSGDGAAVLWAIRCGAFQAIQLSVNVADQQAVDDIIPEALSAGLGIIAKRPIANAVWRSAHLPQEPHMHVYWSRMRALGYGFVGEPDAIANALRFTLHTGVHTAIVGTRSLQHMRSNIEAIRDDLNASDRYYEEIRSTWKQIAGPDWIGQM
jgi:aryl-alcohol dehydrogenase-like predicted oxidoreductase